MTIDFSAIVVAVYWMAIAVGVASIVLIVQVTVMRAAAQARQGRLRRLEDRWQAILAGPAGRIEPLTALPADDIAHLILLWNEAQESARQRGDAAAQATRRHLIDVARRCGLDTEAKRRLRQRDFAERLSAIIMLGHLGENPAQPLLSELTASPNPVISLAAARALLQIDGAAAEQFLRLMIARDDWSPQRLLAIVRQESAALAGPIGSAVLTLPAAASSQLIQYLAFFDPARTLPLVRRLLGGATDSLVIREALKVLAQIGQAGDATLAAGFATHRDWLVRVQAANALGALRDSTQVRPLTGLLEDRHWWVRYRAAQALAALADDAALKGILEAQRDLFARDVLKQIIDERAMLTSAGS